MKLSEILNKIDEYLSNSDLELKGTLNPSADEASFELFKEVCFNGGEIPTELNTLYNWHDGQNDYERLNFHQPNMMFIPIKSVVDNWKFINDPKNDTISPFEENLIPILGNESGDFIMFTKEGALLEYFNDDEARPVAYKSLKQWAKEVLDGLSWLER